MNTIHRNDFLSALCILSFAGSGFRLVLFLLAALFFERAAGIIVEYSAWHSAGAVNAGYFAIVMLLAAVSLAGAWRMWNLHRDGFFIYAAAQISGVLAPVLWIGSEALSSVNVVFTAVFICGYALNLKYLR